MPKPDNFHFSDLTRLLSRLSYQLFIPILLLASMDFVLMRKDIAKRAPSCPQPLYDDPFQSILLTQDLLTACDEKNWDHVSHYVNDKRLLTKKIHHCAVEAAKANNLKILKDLRLRTSLFDLSAQNIFQQLRQNIYTVQDEASTKLMTAFNLLLKHGAKPVIAADQEETSKMMLIAAKEDLHESAEYFQKNKKKLHLTLYKPIKVDLKFSKKETYLLTYLEFACFYGSRNMVNFILKQHALNKVATSKTPKYYTYAAATNHGYLFHLLSMHGLSITEGEIFSLLADLEKAQQEDELKFKLLSQSYNLLIRNFPTPNIYDTQGISMLSRVLDLKSTSHLELFIAHPHINLHMPRKIYSKDLAIFTAVEKDFHEAIVMMYEKGFNLDLRLSKNHTSLKEFIINRMNYTFVTHLGNSTSAMKLRDEIALDFLTTLFEYAVMPSLLALIAILKATLFFADELKKLKKAREKKQLNTPPALAKKEKKVPVKKPSRTEVLNQIKVANLAKNANEALQETRREFKKHLNQTISLIPPVKQRIQKNHESIASLNKKTDPAILELKSECKSHDKEIADCQNALPQQDAIEGHTTQQIETFTASIKILSSRLQTLQVRVRALERSIESYIQSQEKTRPRPTTPAAKSPRFFSQQPVINVTPLQKNSPATTIIAPEKPQTPEPLPLVISSEDRKTAIAGISPRIERIPAPATLEIISFDDAEITVAENTPLATPSENIVEPAPLLITFPDEVKPVTSLTTPKDDNKTPQSFARDSYGFFMREATAPFTHSALLPFSATPVTSETYEDIDFEENNPVIQSIVSLIR